MSLPAKKEENAGLQAILMVVGLCVAVIFVFALVGLGVGTFMGVAYYLVTFFMGLAS